MLKVQHSSNHVDLVWLTCIGLIQVFPLRICIDRWVGGMLRGLLVACTQVVALPSCSEGRLLEVCRLFSATPGHCGEYHCCFARRRFVSANITLP